MLIGFVLVIVACILGALWWNTRDTFIVKIKKNQVMEFRSSMDLSGLPIIVFYQGKNKYNFLLDTGSNVSYVNSKSSLKIDKVEGTESYIGATGDSAICTIANIKLYHGEHEYSCKIRSANLEASFKEVKNSYGITLSGILGNDFFTKYKYCLDFKELVCYARK